MSSTVIALIGLTLAIGVHIAIIARWSGRIDSYIEATDRRLAQVDDEIMRLRQARHDSDGIMQRHEGLIREFTETRRTGREG